MKSVLFTLVSVILFFECTSQNIQNGGFEDWTTTAPDHWSATPSLYGMYDFVFKETADVHSGQFSAKLTSKNVTLYGLVPGVISNGTISQFGITLGGIPFQARPDNFKGYFKYVPVNTDTCLFYAICTKYNTTTYTRDTICYASYNYSSTSVAWEQFQVPFTYLSSSSPDTMLISFLSSKAGTSSNDGSALLLDDICIEACGTIPFNNENICIVSIDTLTWKNVVMWEKTSMVNTKSYNIYKETSLNYYDSLGNVPYSDPAIFIDYSSAPESHADKYKISVIDSCGNESGLSQYHKTMNLVISSFGSTMGLSWSQYEDESGIFIPSKYYIFKGTQPDNMTILDSISSSFTSYNDVNVFNTYYYIIGVRKSHPCNVNGSEMSFSNKKDNSSLVNINSKDLQTGTILIAPNPMTNTTTLTIPNFNTKTTEQLQIMDITGKVVKSISPAHMQIASFPRNDARVEIDRGDLKPGIYFIELTDEGRTFRGKVIVE